MKWLAVGVALGAGIVAWAAHPAWAAESCAGDAALRAALPEADDDTILVRSGGAGTLAQAAGKLWLYDGCTLRALPSAPKAAAPTTAWVFSPTDVWLGVSRKGGDHGGTLLRFDGRAWREVPGTEKLSASPVLWATAPDDVWIGDRDVNDVAVYRWDGRRVARVAFGLAEKLSRGVNVIGGSGPTDVWVAPDDSGWILHGDGKRWVKTTTEFAFHPRSFWAPRPGETWAAGPGNTGRPNVFRWDGVRWQGAGLLPGAAESIVGAGSRMFAALGGGQIVAPDRAEAGAWSPVFSYRTGALGPARAPLGERPPSASGYLQDLHLPLENRGYAFAVRGHALLALHWDGRAWTASGRFPDEVAASLLVSGATLWATTMATLAGGGRPASRVLRWDGARFVPVGMSASPLLELAPAPNDGVWVVGAAGTALLCTTARCVNVATGTDETLIAAWKAGAGVRAVGAGGIVIDSDGGAFRTISPPRGWELKSAWGRERDCVWAVGPNIVRLGARGWNTPGDPEAIDSTVSMNAMSIAGAGCDDLWVLANREERVGGPLFLQWNGKTWLSIGVPATHGWSPRLVTDGGTPWFVGPQGLLWRRGAKGWEPMATGTKETIWSAASYRGDTWVARGDSPIPLRLLPPPALPPKP